MKTVILAMLATTLVVSCSAIAQEKAETAKQDNVNAAKALIVSGRVSDDGRMLLTDIDSEWSVSNADALKGHEGHMVRVRCYVDSAKNKIQILSLKNDAGANYTAARYADSAFRR